jgi:hypothetical protein
LLKVDVASNGKVKAELVKDRLGDAVSYLLFRIEPRPGNFGVEDENLFSAVFILGGAFVGIAESSFELFLGLEIGDRVQEDFGAWPDSWLLKDEGSGRF